MIQCKVFLVVSYIPQGRSAGAAKRFERSFNLHCVPRQGEALNAKACRATVVKVVHNLFGQTVDVCAEREFVLQSEFDAACQELVDYAWHATTGEDWIDKDH